MNKRKLIVNGVKKQVNIGEFDIKWFKKTLIGEPYNVTSSFHNCIAQIFWEEPIKIYNEKGDMYEVTCVKAQRPLFTSKERLKYT